MKKKLMFVVNVDWAFISHRLPIALGAIDMGYEVHLACKDTGKLEVLQKYGIYTHSLPIKRSSGGLISNFFTFFEIARLIYRVRPDVLHLVTVKPILFGGIAARVFNINRVVAAVPGLGFLYIDTGLKAKIRRFFVGLFYKLALDNTRLKVIFQNGDDRNLISGIVEIEEKNIFMIRGSGVDLSLFQIVPLPHGVPVVIMAARLIRDKGVWEFVSAARILKNRGKCIRFCLVGDIDVENPSSLTSFDIQSIKNEGLVEIWGHRENMPEILSKATVVVLPSYREGLPKVLLEAAAAGKAIITTDVPGCRDAIDEGVTGILVPPRDQDALASAIDFLVSNPDQVSRMGEAGRALAKLEFDINMVVAKHMDIYSCF